MKNITNNYLNFLKINTRRFRGEWIVLAGKKIVAHGKRADTVYKKALKSYPKEKIGGIGGSIQVITVKWRIKIGDKILQTLVGWAQSENVPALLGRQDIFDAYEISFKQKEKLITFEEV